MHGMLGCRSWGCITILQPRMLGGHNRLKNGSCRLPWRSSIRPRSPYLENAPDHAKSSSAWSPPGSLISLVRSWVGVNRWIATLSTRPLKPSLIRRLPIQLDAPDHARRWLAFLLGLLILAVRSLADINHWITAILMRRWRRFLIRRSRIQCAKTIRQSSGLFADPGSQSFGCLRSVPSVSRRWWSSSMIHRLGCLPIGLRWCCEVGNRLIRSHNEAFQHKFSLLIIRQDKPLAQTGFRLFNGPGNHLTQHHNENGPRNFSRLTILHRRPTRSSNILCKVGNRPTHSHNGNCHRRYSPWIRRQDNNLGRNGSQLFSKRGNRLLSYRSVRLHSSHWTLQRPQMIRPFPPVTRSSNSFWTGGILDRGRHNLHQRFLNQDRAYQLFHLRPSTIRGMARKSGRSDGI